MPGGIVNKNLKLLIKTAFDKTNDLAGKEKVKTLLNEEIASWTTCYPMAFVTISAASFSKMADLTFKPD